MALENLPPIIDVFSFKYVEMPICRGLCFMWRFPTMGVPPNHQFYVWIFHYKPASYWGSLMEPPSFTGMGQIHHHRRVTSILAATLLSSFSRKDDNNTRAPTLKSSPGIPGLAMPPKHWRCPQNIPKR